MVTLIITFDIKMQSTPLRIEVRKIQGMAGQTRKRVTGVRVLVVIVRCTRCTDCGSWALSRRMLEVPLQSVLGRSSLGENLAGASLYRNQFFAYLRLCTRPSPVDWGGGI